MSKLSFQMEDHPDAATKHLFDANVLEKSNRPDGAAYLAGYVVECSLKSLYLLENGPPLPQNWTHHRLKSLVSNVGAMTGARSAKYTTALVLSIPSMGISAWDFNMRYSAAGSIDPSRAADWLIEAICVYEDTIAGMKLDGVI